MAGGTLTIDLNAVRQNWRALDALSADTVATAAVVKADGYGLSSAKVAATLADAGATWFFVAIAEEGPAVRAAVPQDAKVCIFGGHMAGDTDVLRAHDLTPMLNSVEQIDRHLTALPGHAFGIQLDTGMNRLGLEADDWAQHRDRILAQSPVLVMSHLACADEPDHAMNAMQLANFHAMTDGIPVRRSLAATGGTLMGPDFHFDLTRPGVGLYGGFPFEDAVAVVHLDLPVIQTRAVAVGETVGYAAGWTAQQPSVIATVSSGYADGLIRAQSGRGTLYAGDVPCPIVGRVSMDLIGVDVTHLDHVPDALTILGPHQGVDAVADAAGTIGYEILTSLGHRYARRYVPG